MKKETGIVVAIIVAVALIVGGWLLMRKSSPKTQPAQTSQQQVEAPQVGTEKNVVGSIKDAMGLGTKMMCTYSVGSGNSKFESTAFVDGKKFKSSSVIAGNATFSYFDGENMYIWMDGQKTGTKMSMSCINDFKASLPQGQQPASANDIKAPEDQFNGATDTKCEPASNADFSLPADVAFTDQCEMLKNLQKNIPANMPKLPPGVNIPQY